jgi:hypothetical protein
MSTSAQAQVLHIQFKPLVWALIEARVISRPSQTELKPAYFEYRHFLIGA